MSNPYLLQPIKIIKSERLAQDINLITFDDSFIKFIPGQFLMINIPGFGEAPFGIMQPTCTENKLQLLIRGVGDLTNKVLSLKKSDTVLVRGPLGNGFPLSHMKNKNIVMFAGGTGIVPIKALMDYVKNHQNNFGQIQLFYGAKSPENIFFQKELNICQKFADILLAVEKHEKNWEGNTGLITSLISSKTTLVENSVAVLCGPPIMYKFVIEKLKKIGYKDQDMYLSFERRIRCGIGKCQHCTCGDKYVCTDGPIFSHDEVLKMPEEII